MLEMRTRGLGADISCAGKLFVCERSPIHHFAKNAGSGRVSKRGSDDIKSWFCCHIENTNEQMLS